MYKTILLYLKKHEEKEVIILKTYINSTLFKLCTLLISFVIILPSFLPTVNSLTLSRVTNIESMTPVTVTLNEVNNGYTKKTIDKVPLLNQLDYPHVDYGEFGTIASHGCGIVSLAMVASYLTDAYVDPVNLAQKYGNYNTEAGSQRIIFKAVAEDLGINLVDSGTPQGEYYTWEEAKSALEEGKVIICGQSKGVFTGGGHFIVLTSLTEDGKVMVNDPNGYNWMKYPDEFNNGFTEEQIYENANAYWIFEK